MHFSLILLTLASILLIALMVGCFFCFVRSRKKEDEELMQRVQYSNHQRQQQQHLLSTQLTPQRHETHKLSPSPSDQSMISDLKHQQQQQHHQLQQHQREPMNQMSMAEFQARSNSYSPYHSQPSANMMVQANNQQRNETGTDITQQINSAIIGSSEAEFQNDFIQVFPMYQIAPQPEKNTTPYLT